MLIPALLTGFFSHIASGQEAETEYSLFSRYSKPISLCDKDGRNKFSVRIKLRILDSTYNYPGLGEELKTIFEESWQIAAAAHNFPENETDFLQSELAREAQYLMNRQLERIVEKDGPIVAMDPELVGNIRHPQPPCPKLRGGT